MIRPQHLKRAYSYRDYKTLLEKLLAQGKTTGHDQSDTMISYARLNLQRMLRVEKNLDLSPEAKETVAQVHGSFVWLVLTEGWCGDTAHTVPVLNAIAALSPRIDLKLLLRDDNPDVMEQFLTNGSRSIPKLICIEKDTLHEVFTWGPRPEVLQKEVLRMIGDDLPKDERNLFVQKWYNGDQGRTAAGEMLSLIRKHMCS